MPMNDAYENDDEDDGKYIYYLSIDLPSSIN